MTGPNILFLVTDSLRYDATTDSCDIDIPRMETLSENGVLFANCHSQGISTAPAMTAILTGRLPLDYGGHWYLEEEQPTFAQQFNRAGYTTGAVHSNPYVSKRRNFDRGFDFFDEDVVAFEPDRKLERAPEKILRLFSRLSRILSRTPYTPAPEINERLLNVVDQADSPWFLWGHYMDVHGPYLGGKATYRKKFPAEILWRKAAVNSPDEITEAEHTELVENYRKEVEYVDEHIGELLASLDEQGTLENTIVVLTADHGDEFHEHGRYGHGNLPYSELTHVPLVIRFPESMHVESTEVDELVRSIDILPTILDYLEIEYDNEMDERVEGKSLRPLIENGQNADPPEYAVTEKRVRDEDALRIGIRNEEWSFIYDGKDGSTELYDLTKDSNEQNDIAGEERAPLSRFKEMLEDRFEQISQTSENVTIPDLEESAEVEERLRALGYKD